MLILRDRIIFLYHGRDTPCAVPTRLMDPHRDDGMRGQVRHQVDAEEGGGAHNGQRLRTSEGATVGHEGGR